MRLDHYFVKRWPVWGAGFRYQVLPRSRHDQVGNASEVFKSEAAAERMREKMERDRDRYECALADVRYRRSG